MIMTPDWTSISISLTCTVPEKSTKKSMMVLDTFCWRKAEEGGKTNANYPTVVVFLDPGPILESTKKDHLKVTKIVRIPVRCSCDPSKHPGS